MRIRWAIVLLAVASRVTAQEAPAAPTWSGLEFLIGEWVTETSGGVPGAATSGGFSLRADLQGRVLVRRNVADYAAVGDRPALHHEDLMIVSADAGGRPAQAVYFDNEGHTIRYAVDASTAGVVVLVSEAEAKAPRFRLTYRRTAKDKHEGRFEIAPPGKPDAFSPYVEWTARRKGD
jgi:hypothetical protein